MLAFAIRRLIEAAFVMVTVALLAFVLFRFVGDPVNQMVSQDAPLEERIKLRQDLGLDEPVSVQFGRFIWKAARFDFGVSYQVKQPVVTLIADRFRLPQSSPSPRPCLPWRLASRRGSTPESIETAGRRRCS
jgi:peptide/nickel transport system permease protein